MRLHMLRIERDGGAIGRDRFALPPRIGEVTFGLTVFPWEHRGRHQRFGIDLRLSAQYVSEGHDFGPLFDALGTSRSRYLTEPNCEGIPRDGMDCQPGSDTLRPVEFFGLTDIQAHGVIGAHRVHVWTVGDAGAVVS